MHRGTVHDEGGNGVNGKSMATIEVYGKLGGHSLVFPRIRTFINFDNSQCKYKKGDRVSFNILPAKLTQVPLKDINKANSWFADNLKISVKTTDSFLNHIEVYCKRLLPALGLTYLFLLGANYLISDHLGSLFIEKIDFNSFLGSWCSNLLMELAHLIILGLTIILWKGGRSPSQGAITGLLMGFLFGVILIINYGMIGFELSPSELLFYIVSYILKLTLAGAILGKGLYSEKPIVYGVLAPHNHNGFLVKIKKMIMGWF